MLKILFLIHDLGQGGAEKVLVNLVNNMDSKKFDISVIALFGGGVNEQYLKPHIHYRAIFSKTFRGNIHVMKLLTPQQLHRLFIRERYDVEVSYLEGPSARIISGCMDEDTKTVSWIHCTAASSASLARSFRSEKEMRCCYNSFDRMIFVARTSEEAFRKSCPLRNRTEVLYNTNESEKILAWAQEPAPLFSDCRSEIYWCGMGKVTPNKGFDRMLRIQKRLLEEGYPVHLCILGDGPQRAELEQWCRSNGISESVTFLGYQTNPYQYLAKCDLYVCASHSEGFSTAATEALIVGTPVCTVEVSGMKEMLGDHDEWGIVTENDDEALYRGIRRLLDAPECFACYRQKAGQRGKMFSTENTVRAVEEMLMQL